MGHETFPVFHVPGSRSEVRLVSRLAAVGLKTQQNQLGQHQRPGPAADKPKPHV